MVHFLCRFRPGIRDEAWFAKIRVAISIDFLHCVSEQSQTEDVVMGALDLQQRFKKVTIGVLAFVNEKHRKGVNQDALDGWFLQKKIRYDLQNLSVAQGVLAAVVTCRAVDEF